LIEVALGASSALFVTPFRQTIRFFYQCFLAQVREGGAPAPPYTMKINALT
jgi:hypothetical protein